MTGGSVPTVPRTLATSLDVETVRSAFEGRRRAQARRWSPEQTREWVDKIAEKVQEDRRARSDCNMWLKRVSSPLPAQTKPPDAYDLDNVRVYVNFLWLSADPHVQHTTALEPIIVARLRWQSLQRKKYKTIQDLYPGDDEVPLRTPVALPVTGKPAQQGRRSEVTYPKPSIASAASTSISSTSRRAKQKRKAALGRLESEQPIRKESPDIHSSIATRNDNLSAFTRQPRNSLPSFKKRRTTVPDAPHQPSHACLSANETSLASDITSQSPSAAELPLQALLSHKGSDHQHPVQSRPIMETTEAPIRITSSACVVPLSNADFAGDARLAGSDVSMQDPRLIPSENGMLLETTAQHEHPEGIAHPGPSWYPPSSPQSSAVDVHPTTPPVKAEPKDISLDGILPFPTDSEVDVKPAVTPVKVPMELCVDASAEAASASGRPALKDYDIRPPIWAQHRQEVCEATDYFRSYQGGVYFSSDQVYGYLLGGFPSKRDAFEHGGRLIISHGGGGKPEASLCNHTRAQHKDAETGDQHLEDKSVQALLSNWRNHYPVVLLADDHYALFPFDLAKENYVYIILGYYWVTNVWAECNGVRSNGEKIVRYKVAFQWCDGQGDPWWSPPSPRVDVPETHEPIVVADAHVASVVPVPTGDRGDNVGSSIGKARHRSLQAHKATRCLVCAIESIQVYTVGWMCLNPGCRAFWTLNGLPCSLDGLTFDHSFTALQSQPGDIYVNVQSLTPPPPPTGGPSAVITSRRYSRGMHCSACGRLSCRYKWSRYECSGGCGTVIMVEAGIRKPRELWTQMDFLDDMDELSDPNTVVQPEAAMRSPAGERFLVTSYVLPFGRGQIHRIRCPPRLNHEANAIFREYQEQAASGELEFRRFPLRAHQCALAAQEARQAQTLTRVHPGRGTLLTGYFSQNSGAPYNYIGGSDYTLPLGEGGASAVLHAVNLIKHRVKAIIGDYIPFNEIMSVAYMEDQRMAFHADAERGLGPVVASLSLGSTSQMHFRRSKHDITNDDVAKGGHVLTMVLKHGDILVMQGSEIQDYYEHTVEPMGFRMVATARVISPENYANDVKAEPRG